jgi:hypothetical protein
MLKYFLFFAAMLIGAGVGIFLGLLLVTKNEHRAGTAPVSAEPKPKIVPESEQPSQPVCTPKQEPAAPPVQNAEGLIKARLGEYISEEATPDEADELLEKMRTQDQRYCTLKDT